MRLQGFCGSKEEILCEEDRDLELQLLNAVKVRNSEKTMFFARSLLAADVDTTKDIMSINMWVLDAGSGHGE